MRLRHFIGRLASLVIFTIVPAAGGAPRPNVVILLSDDQGWGDLSASGNTNLSTPNIDSLARDGVSFDRFYVCPLCAPTRAEFLTGCYHPRTGVTGVSTGRERLNTDERTIADVFRAAGYTTGCFGKWHNGTQWPYHPRARGFNEFYGITHGHWGWYFNPPLDHNGEHAKCAGYVADDFTTHAIQFIESNKDRPFFCYLPFNTPHSPFAVPDEYWQRFKDKPLALRGTPAGRRQENIDETRCALAMVENLDHNVGRILKRLDELKVADNTIVLFFCDNGPNGARFNGGMKGIKSSTDEGGVRSPLFVRWPGNLKPNTKVEPIAAAIDLLPTLAALAHVPLPPDGKPLDGIDLTPLLYGAETPWPGRAIVSHNAGRVSVRSQRYRLDDAGALFDMATDPGQTKDLSKEKPAVAATLTAVATHWRKDVLPERAADTRPFPVGHRDAPLTMLPARDAVPHGTIRRSSSAPNCSYFVNWTATTDAITWDIDVLEPGLYEATVLYTCPEPDAGSTVELSFKDTKLSTQVTPAWDPPLAPNQDTIPRPAGESKMKDFRPLSLGRIRLEKSHGDLTLRATAIPGRSVMDLFQLDLRRVSE